MRQKPLARVHAYTAVAVHWGVARATRGINGGFVIRHYGIVRLEDSRGLAADTPAAAEHVGVPTRPAMPSAVVASL